MKTLKKTLCLVLAVVMVVGALVLPASAKDYGDIESVGKDYKTAVTTLQTWRIMEGDNAGNFKPEASIQRQEMAAIVYRVMTGDIKGADGKDNSAIYAPYATAKFADVKATDWAAGYIGYCANKGIVLGTNDAQTTFEPTRAIPANDVLAMLLRCLGYTQKDEFTGANWADKVGALATRLGLTEKITRALNEASQRQEVAQMTYKAAAAASRVTWSDSEQDYIPYVNPNDPGSKANDKLVYQSGGDTSTSSKRDQWGGVGDTTTNATKVTFYYPVPSVSKEVVAASSASSVKAHYFTAVSQCDLAKALTQDKKFGAIVYTNGIENRTKVEIDPLNTTAQIGAQGRETLVYANTEDDTKADYPFIIVYKDTLLAKVTKVTKSTKDAQGHTKTNATLTLHVYIGTNPAQNVTTSTTVNEKKGVVEVNLTSKDDFTYAKGDYVLINYHQNDDLGTTDYKFSNPQKTDPYTIREDGKWAAAQKYIDKFTFVEGNTVKGDWNKDSVVDINDFVKIVGKADSFNGAQTKITYNGNSHTIDDKANPDNNRYVLDDAQHTMKVPFTWFQDTKGNVIGSVVISTSSTYGVITRIWASINSADGSTTVKANVTYVDGTTQTVDVANVSYQAGKGVNKKIDGTLTGGKATYTDAANKAMTTDANSLFYVSDSYDTNWAEDNKTSGEGIILDHLFKITANGSAYDFVEVAGSKENTGSYKGLGNATTSITSGKASNGVVQVDDDTVFMIRSIDATNTVTFTTVTGYKNVDSYVEGEVDYVNCDDDAAAEYVYIITGKKGTEGWHLFFADSKVTSDKDNDQALVQVDNNGKTYTVYGYLDGVYGSVTIKQDQQGYKAGDNAEKPDTWTGTDLTRVFGKDMSGNTLWMVYIKDGYVIDINGAKTQNGKNAVLNPANGDNRKADFANGVPFSDTTNGMMNPSAVLYGNDDDSLGIYAKQTLMIVDVADKAPVTSGGTITLGGKTLTLNDSAIVGSWDDLANVGQKIAGTTNTVKYTVIVVYDTKTETITQAYIYSKDDGSKYTGSGDDTTVKDTATYTLKVENVEYSNKTTTVTCLASAAPTFRKDKDVVFTVELQVMVNGIANTWTTLQKAEGTASVGSDTRTGIRLVVPVDYELTAGGQYRVKVTAAYKDTKAPIDKDVYAGVTVA